jgi:hypothetical protein
MQVPLHRELGQSALPITNEYPPDSVQTLICIEQIPAWHTPLSAVFSPSLR